MTDTKPATETTTLYFRTNWTAMILIVAACSCVLLGFAALDPSLLRELSEQRRAGWLAYLTVFEYGGVNWAVAAMMIGLIWESRKPIAQWHDPAALRHEGGNLIFHPSAHADTIAVSELYDIAYEAGALKSDLVVTFKTGKTVRIRNVDDCGAQNFVSMTKRLLEQT